MNHKLLQQISQDLHQSTPDYVHGVGMGYKQKDGKITDELSMVFFVTEKKPLSEIPENERIPSTLEVDGQTINTDVVEMQMAQAYCTTCPLYTTASSPTPPNRSRFRPLQQGMSVSNPVTGGIGTMGLIAVDNETNTLVGVSNNHVLIPDAFYTTQRNLSGIIDNTIGDVVIQPGDGGTFPGDFIGNVKNYEPIYKLNATPTDVNYVDVATLTLQESQINNTTSLSQIGFTGATGVLPWATTSEIDGLLSTKPFLFSTGRTTGPKGENDCKLIPWYNGITITLAYDLQGVSTVAKMSDVFGWVKSASTIPAGNVCYWPGGPGDSGSAVIADFSGTYKVIGLLFAGAADNTGQPIIAYGCRIDRIADALNLSPWTGQTVCYSSWDDRLTCTVEGGSDEPYIVLNGLRYYQVGLTTNPSLSCT